jgi:hypothetical protein
MRSKNCTKNKNHDVLHLTTRMEMMFNTAKLFIFCLSTFLHKTLILIVTLRRDEKCCRFMAVYRQMIMVNKIYTTAYVVAVHKVVKRAAI